jgi:formate C-acetyltransferase
MAMAAPEIGQRKTMEWRAGQIKEAGSTPRVRKLNQQFHSQMTSVCLDRARIYTKVMKETEGEPMIIRRAKAFKQTMEEKSIFILPHELLVGSEGYKQRAKTIYPEWNVWLRDEVDTLDTRPHDPYDITPDQKRDLKEEILPYWKDQYCVSDLWFKRCPPEIIERVTGNNICEMSIIRENTISHYLPPYTYLFEVGFEGIRHDAEKKLAKLDLTQPESEEKANFYRAAILVCEGMEAIGMRFANLARDMAKQEKDAQRRKELEQIAEVCEWVPANPPRSFREAMQFFTFVQIYSHVEGTGPSHSPGRFDQYMYPLFKKDVINNKTLTGEQAQELLECCWIKMSEIAWFMSDPASYYFAGYGPFMNLTVGGQLVNGKDGTNELTYMVIDAIMETRTYQPTVSVRWWQKTPKKLKRKVADLISMGMGHPSNFNDEVGIQMCLNRGYTIEEAKNWAPIGCVEPGVEGMQYGLTNAGQLNMGGMVEMVLTNGVQRLTGKKLGAETGDPRNFKNFDEFMEAVKQQISFFIKHWCVADLCAEKLHAEVAPTPFQSILTFGCMEKGKDLTLGGAKINVGPTIVAIGVADIGNSLASVKKLVYEDKTLTMDALCRALEIDFAGCEDLRQQLLYQGPKFGNDDEYVDLLTAEIMDHFAKETWKYKSTRGNKLDSGIIPVTTHVAQGTGVGALPSGRKAWAPLADGCSPMQGTDRNGPTAAVLSETKINHEYLSDGTLTNMWFNKSALDDEEGRDKLGDLISTYCDLGGFHIQFNCIDKDMLKEAQLHPEEYPSLMVRVAGYSAYFVDLSRDIQNDIISRTEHQL